MSTTPGRRPQLLVYCDYPYRRSDGVLTAEQPFARFLAGLHGRAGDVTMVGRLDHSAPAFPYRVDGPGFVALPHYASGADPRALWRTVPMSLRRFWQALGPADAALVFGPTPLALLFAVMAVARGRRLVLGVRQDLPRVFAHRYADRRLLRGGAWVLERSFRLLARRSAVVVVGPQLAEHYRRAKRMHMAWVSLLDTEQVTATDGRDYAGPELRMLSVGRLDPEKNPLLLAEILAGARRADPRWRLDVCGDGPLLGALRERLEALGVADAALLHGHVPIDDGLLGWYDSSHALIHVSHTEGAPQVVLEAFARRLPVVATAVGGVPELVGGCAQLIAPRDAAAAVRALQRVSDDPALRTRLVDQAGLRVAAHTRDQECERLAAFIDDVVRH